MLSYRLQREGPGFTMRVYFLLAIALALLVTIFAVQNNEPITIQFFFWEAIGSLALVLMLTLVLGIIVGLLIAAPSLLRGKIENSKQRKKVASIEAQMAAIPASPSPQTSGELVEDPKTGIEPD